MCGFEKWIVGILITITICALAFVLYAGYVESTKPTFTLVKEYFSCTQSHKQIRMQVVGKITVPVTETICDQWTRK